MLHGACKRTQQRPTLLAVVSRSDALWYSNPEKKLQCACTDVSTRSTLLWFLANRRNIVGLRFTGHRAIQMLGLVAPKFDRFQTIRNKCQQVPTLLWFHANGYMQHNMPNNTACCWPTLLRLFAWALRRLGREESAPARL